MTRNIFCLTLALALACCLLAPGANAEAPEQGVTFKKYTVESDAPNAYLTVEIDYPAGGDPKEAAAVRRALDVDIDALMARYGVKTKPGKNGAGDIRARLDALAKAFRKLPKKEDSNWGLTHFYHWTATGQDRKTVTFEKVGGIFGNGGPPTSYHIVRKSDGVWVENSDLFVLPGTKPPASEGEEADAAEGGGEDAYTADFVAEALRRAYGVGVAPEGLCHGERTGYRGNGLNDCASWADLPPYLTPLGLELFAEHLPKTAQGAGEARPASPTFRRVEKTIGVKRGKGAKQGAAKVKAVVDRPEGGEPKATAALGKGVDALLAQCAAGNGVVKASLELRYRDPRLVTYECTPWQRDKEDGMLYPASAGSFVATLSAADGRRIGLADLAEVTDERWRELLRDLMSGSDEKELSAYPAPAQTAVALLYDGLEIEDLRKGEGKMDFWRKLPYEDLAPHLTPAGKALLGR